jgi:DNA-binding XRE family transcriptional regulator
MRDEKRKDLEASGWKVGTAEEFLSLTDAEAALVEMKLALSDGLRALRMEKGLRQADVARAIGSSQSRVAKMEAADPSVSMDLLVRTLLRLGGSPETVAGLVSGDSRQKAAF